MRQALRGKSEKTRHPHAPFYRGRSAAPRRLRCRGRNDYQQRKRRIQRLFTQTTPRYQRRKIPQRLFAQTTPRYQRRKISQWLLAATVNYNQRRMQPAENVYNNRLQQRPMDTSCAPGGRHQPCSEPPPHSKFLSMWPAGVPISSKGGNYLGLNLAFPCLVASEDCLHHKPPSRDPSDVMVRRS